MSKKSVYQKNYAAGRKQMYDMASREQKAQRMIKTLADFLGEDKLKKLTVLDVGASTGIIDNALAQSFKKVIGIDIDKKAIAFAKNAFKKKNLKFETGDAMKLSFANNSFDVVICAHVYEHVPDAEKLFDEIHRVLKPGGICYLAAINRLWPWEPHYDLPFLSWLPKPLADKYVKFTGKANKYYETPRTYCSLKILTQKFKVIDYTPKILTNPRKFGYGNFSFGLLAILAKYFTPTMFWLLIKRE